MASSTAPFRLALLIFISAAIPSCCSGKGNPRNCMPSFYQNKNLFEKCKKNICFMFLDQKPYIKLGKHKKKPPVLFRCIDFKRNDLKGISLSVFKKIVNRKNDNLKDTQCIWAGNSCSFGDLDSFLVENGGDYQFAIMGFLLEVSSRMTPELFPSTSLFDDRMVIIGPVKKEGPLHRLKRPFRTKAWYLFGSMLIIFLIFGVLVVWAFSPEKFSLITMILHFLGEESSSSDVSAHNSHNELAGESSSSITLSDSDEGQIQTTNRDALLETSVNRNRQAMYKAAILLWRIALSAFLVILLLFYEVAVVNFLFQEQSTPNNVAVNTLNKASLKKYAVLKNSALEGVWQRTGTIFLRSSNSRGNGAILRMIGMYSGLPEYAAGADAQTRRARADAYDVATRSFNLVTNKSSGVEYVVTYGAMGDYQLQTRRKCSVLTVWSTEKRLYSFGAGWLYGKKVPLSTRRTIDKKILDLRVTDQMRELVINITGQKGKCDADRGDIEASIILLPLAVLVGPCLIGLVIVLIISWRRRIRAEREEQAAVATSTDELIDVSIEAHNAAYTADRAPELRRRAGQLR